MAYSKTENEDSEKDERRRKAVHDRQQSHENGKMLCRHCDFTGFVTAEEKKGGNQFAFRCIFCAASERLGLSQKIMAWSHGLSEKFELKMLG